MEKMKYEIVRNEVARSGASAQHEILTKMIDGAHDFRG